MIQRWPRSKKHSMLDYRFVSLKAHYYVLKITGKSVTKSINYIENSQYLVKDFNGFASRCAVRQKTT